MKVIFFILLLAMILICALFAGCETLKVFKSKKQDSVSVKTNNVSFADSSKTTNIKKTDEKSKEDFEWWKITYPGRDTVINNFITQPVIYEGGRGTREVIKTGLDSLSIQMLIKAALSNKDSTGKKTEETDSKKQSETKGVGLTTLLIVLGAFFIITKGAEFLFNNFKILRK